jgi:hypothetical protein
MGIRTNHRRSSEAGQAATEALFAFPVMLVLFLIGFQLYSISWNAQYVHVRARYQIIHDNDRKACYAPKGNQIGGGDHSASASAPETVDDTILYTMSGTRNISTTAHIYCNMP